MPIIDFPFLLNRKALRFKHRHLNANESRINPSPVMTLCSNQNPDQTNSYSASDLDSSWSDSFLDPNSCGLTLVPFNVLKTEFETGLSLAGRDHNDIMQTTWLRSDAK